jgi:hypothetical protein
MFGDVLWYPLAQTLTGNVMVPRVSPSRMSHYLSTPLEDQYRYAPPDFPILPLLPATGEQHRRARSALALAQFGHRDTSQYQNQRHTVKPLKILVQD